MFFLHLCLISMFIGAYYWPIFWLEYQELGKTPWEIRTWLLYIQSLWWNTFSTLGRPTLQKLLHLKPMCMSVRLYKRKCTEKLCEQTRWLFRSCHLSNFLLNLLKFQSNKIVQKMKPRPQKNYVRRRNSAFNCDY